VAVDAQRSTKTNKTTPGSGGRILFKKDLTGPTLLEMSGYAAGFPETQIPSDATFLQKPFRFATLLEQLKLIQRMN
jgi:hypothetical protein